jgi:lysophospholipid acyltransferase (LPLAT)-like uncharacterized protein
MRRVARILGTLVGRTALTALLRTTRVEVAGSRSYLGPGDVSRPVVFALWHGRLLPLAWLHRDEGVVGLVSRSEDGELIARVMHAWGFGVVRGSSSRGGSSALRELVRHVQEGRSLALTPDGPRGPRQRMKPGALLVASVAGVPIVPVAAGARRAWWFGSWDRLLVPKPFARVAVRYGAPIALPRDLTPLELAEWSERVEVALNALTAQVDREVAG